MTAASATFSDGELRPVPLLPGRVHLLQSRFVTLHDRDRREMTFADLARNDDPTRINEQMVVTVDAQLFDSVLQALPYLVNYPYECTEQTLNRFVSTGIVSSLFRDYPAVAKMAEEFSKRDTRLETWDAADPEPEDGARGDALARGGQRRSGHGAASLPRPRPARRHGRARGVARQAAKGADGVGRLPLVAGRPSLSLHDALHPARLRERSWSSACEVPKDMVQRAWSYAGTEVRRDLEECMRFGHFCPLVTFVNYMLSSYPDESWYRPAFDAAYRQQAARLLLRALEGPFADVEGPARADPEAHGTARGREARLGQRHGLGEDRPDLGTYWAPEDRSWLWYNDTIETQAFALRTLVELDPADPRRAGLVQWLFLNKKLNQWKSTRATAEVLYSLAKYLKKEGALGDPRGRDGHRRRARGRRSSSSPTATRGRRTRSWFPARSWTRTASTVIVEKEGKGLAFASATWHFSTEQLPAGGPRRLLLGLAQVLQAGERPRQGFVLKPLAEGRRSSVPGDEIEVQISLPSKARSRSTSTCAIRAPPGSSRKHVSHARSGTWESPGTRRRATAGRTSSSRGCPRVEYTFKYRLRANMAGIFRVGPATVQSMYAPEFAAYSAGATLTVKVGLTRRQRCR